jgi:Holliday junction resolvase
MALTPEKKVKNKCVTLIKAYGVYYFFPSMNGFGRSGVPDIICCANGNFLGVECKAGTNKPTDLQLLEMVKIRDAGGKTLVVNEDNLNELEELLKELTNATSRDEQGSANSP